MKNILKDSPQTVLAGRLRYTTRIFIQTKDISGKKVLNIGCGYGWFELWSIKHKVGKIIGIEIDNESLTAARSIKDPRVNFKVGSAIKLSFTDNSFDTVVSWEVLEHIPKKTETKMFSEVSRVLKKGGIFYLSTPNRNPVACAMDPAWWLIGHRHYRKEDLRRYAHQSGLKMKEFILRGGWMEIFFMLNLYFSKWVLHRRPLFEKQFLKWIDIEYEKDAGFTTIFARLINLKNAK